MAKKSNWCAKYNGKTNGSTTKVSLRMPCEVHDMAVLAARDQDITLSVLITGAVRNYLSNHCG